MALYSVIQLNFTPELEVLLVDRSILSTTYLKRHMQYFHFRCQIQLDLPVGIQVGGGVRGEVAVEDLALAHGAPDDPEGGWMAQQLRKRTSIYHVQSSPLIWSMDVRSTCWYGQFLAGLNHKTLILISNPDIRSARSYGQLSLYKTLTLQAGATVHTMQLAIIHGDSLGR